MPGLESSASSSKVTDNGQEVEKEVRGISWRKALMPSVPRSGRLSGVHARCLKKPRLGQGSDCSELAVIHRINPEKPEMCPGRLSAGGNQRVAIHGCSPYENGKARMIA